MVKVIIDDPDRAVRLPHSSLAMMLLFVLDTIVKGITKDNWDHEHYHCWEHYKPAKLLSSFQPINRLVEAWNNFPKIGFGGSIVLDNQIVLAIFCKISIFCNVKERSYFHPFVQTKTYFVSFFMTYPTHKFNYAYIRSMIL